MDSINELLQRLELDHQEKNGEPIEMKAKKEAKKEAEKEDEKEKKPERLRVYVASKLPPNHSYFKSVEASNAPWKKSKNKPEKAKNAVTITPPSQYKVRAHAKDYGTYERWGKYDKRLAKSDRDREAKKTIEEEHSVAKEFLLALQKEHEDEAKIHIDDEDRVVEGLKVTLLDHQVRGLRFFRKQESSKNAHKGGLLCDDMGLGKTVQMISLILSNRPTPTFRKKSNNIPATLVICPLAVASQWCTEISTKAPSLKVHLFHDSDKATESEQFTQFDVVVTTYNTALWDAKKEDALLTERNWWRIILDEAHTIKNHKSQSARACFALSSSQKWCLTGTPLHNKLDEMRSYLMFLNMSRYVDERYWNSDIKKAIQKNPDHAIDLLKKDFGGFFLRRSKAVLQQSASGFHLPPKTVHFELVEFDATERLLYTIMEKRVKDVLIPKENRDEYKELKSQVYLKVNEIRGRGYLSALVCLLRLRQICCHWNLIYGFKEEELADNYNYISETSESSITASGNSVGDLDEMMKELEVTKTKCSLCRSRFTSQNAEYCSECKSLIGQKSPPLEQSAKSVRLLKILQQDSTRKTIIFSQFTQLLAALDPVLEKNGFQCVKYDGSMSRPMRDLALKKFAENSETTILLCSMKCGAIGLNLTVANRVVLYDPWWNPQVEDQAVDRVYRFGQTKEVDVYRLIVKDSVEQKIASLQEKKRQVAEAVLDVYGKKNVSINSGLTQKELFQLFGLKFSPPD